MYRLCDDCCAEWFDTDDGGKFMCDDCLTRAKNEFATGADRIKCPVCGESMCFIYNGWNCDNYFNHPSTDLGRTGA